MLELREAFERSELTVHGFSKLHNISTAILYRWKNAAQGTEKKLSGFSRLSVQHSSVGQAASLFAEVNGIKIYQVVSATYLKELLK
jgi:hypothetical protein